MDSLPAKAKVHCTYDQAWFAKISDVEERHFWFRARRRLIASIVSQILSSKAPGFRVLEAGCGTGNVLTALEQKCSRGTVIGMDLLSEGLHFARQNTSCHLVQGDVSEPPFSKTFDLICLFDVLEHMPNDTQVIGNLHRILSQDGVLLLTVPATPSLWSYFDEASHHCRRYEPGELKNKLVGSGYIVEYMTHYMTAIYPLVRLGRKFRSPDHEQKLSDTNNSDALASTELRIIPVVNNILYALLSFEAKLIARRWHLPMGTSLFAIARKK